MDRELRGLRLGAQNAQVAFLNARIAERTFPWSLLFERIAATLPDGVRLRGLDPVFTSADDQAPATRAPRPKARPRTPRRSRRGAAEELVNLNLVGAAKSDESLYQLVDALFASPSFASPRLHQESTNGAEVEFTVDVDYRPRFTRSRRTGPRSRRGGDGRRGVGRRERRRATTDAKRAAAADRPRAEGESQADRRRGRARATRSASAPWPRMPVRAGARPALLPRARPRSNRPGGRRVMLPAAWRRAGGCGRCRSRWRSPTPCS